MNIENEGTCVQQHILDVTLLILPNLSKATLTDTSAYFGLKLNCKIIGGGGGGGEGESIKCKWPVRTFD